MDARALRPFYLLLFGTAALAVAVPPAISAAEIARFSPDFDISLTSHFLWQSVTDAEYQNGLIYLLMASGLRVYDPEIDFVSPRVVAELSLDDSYLSLRLAGDFALLGIDPGRLAVVDISDPEDPRRISSIELEDTIFDFTVSGSVIYAACGFGGVHVIDMSEPASLRKTAVLDEGVHPVAVEVHGAFLYAADDFNGVLAYSLEDPSRPALSSIALFLEPVRDLAVYDGRMYLAVGDSGIVSYEFELPLSLKSPFMYRTSSRAERIKIGDGAVLALDFFGTVYLFDPGYEDPRHFFEGRGASDKFDFVRKNGRDYLLLPDRSGNFEIIRVDRGAVPNSLWSLPGSGRITSVAVIGDLVIAAAGGADLTAWRIIKGRSPSLVATLNVAAPHSVVAALDSMLVVAENSFANDSWVRVFNVLEPYHALNMKRNMIAWSHVSDMKIEYNDSGAIELTTFGSEGTTLFTLEGKGEEPDDLYAVLERTFVPSRFSQTAAERSGGYLYTCHKKGPGNIFDVSGMEPDNQPAAVGSFDSHGRIYCIEIIDSLCYLGGTSGLRVNRMDGFLIGETLIQIGSLYNFLDVDFDWRDSLMFAALGNDGVAVYDLSEPAAPELICLIRSPIGCERVDASNGRLAVSDGYSVKVFDYSLPREGPALPRRFELAQNYPNPFNISTRIDFSIPGDPGSSCHARLEIVNSLGRIVRTIADRQLPAGFHSYIWDGADDSGRELASGVYLYRLSLDGVSSAKKMVLLK